MIRTDVPGLPAENFKIVYLTFPIFFPKHNLSIVRPQIDVEG